MIKALPKDSTESFSKDNFNAKNLGIHDHHLIKKNQIRFDANKISKNYEISCIYTETSKNISIRQYKYDTKSLVD